MRIEKLDISTITQEQFAQIIDIEKNCGLKPYSPQMLQDCITDLDTFAYFEGNDIVGFITVHPSSRYLGGGLYIVNLNVARPYRRQGIGRKLMLSACSEYAISRYGSVVTLDVGKTNVAALSLYRKLGFVMSNIPSANGDTDIVMTAPLNDLCGSIQTNRLVLKPLSPKDIATASLLLQNNIIKRTYMIPDLTQDSAERLSFRLLDLSLCSDHYVRGIYLDEDLIGFINDTEIVGSVIELGWVLHPDHHNRGYATEAVSAAIQNLLGNGYACVTAGAFEENRASIRVMQKAGMQRMEKTEVIEYRGQNHNCVYYKIGGSV